MPWQKPALIRAKALTACNSQDLSIFEAKLDEAAGMDPEAVHPKLVVEARATLDG
jgi:hypothetical protein